MKDRSSRATSRACESPPGSSRGSSSLERSEPLALRERKHGRDVFHAAVAFDIAQELGFVHGVAEADAVELELAAHILQRHGMFLLDDILRKIDDLKDALKGDHGGAELNGRAHESLQGRVQGADVGAEGDDGTDGEGALDDQVTAQAVGQRRAEGADDAQQRKQGHAQHGATDADIADAGGTLAEAALLVRPRGRRA